MLLCGAASLTLACSSVDDSTAELPPGCDYALAPSDDDQTAVQTLFIEANAGSTICLAEGTYHFKKQWGAQPAPLAWEYRLLGASTVPDHSPKNPKFALAIRAWTRLPVPVATLLGPRIVRSIP